MQADSDTIEAAVRANLAVVLDPPVPEDRLELTGRLVDDYGLTSLNRVLFLTAVCQDTGISLSAFTEVDLARMVTVDDVVRALTRAAGLTVA
jgi:acyl carrier protein